MQFLVTPEGRVQASGRVVPDTADAFRSFLEANDRLGTEWPTVLELQSSGGNLAAAIRVGRLIRQHRMDVLVVGTCASACAYMAMGGVRRGLGRRGRIGVHRFFFPNDPRSGARAAEETQQFSAFLLQYISEMGIGVGFFTTASGTSSNSITFLDQEQLRRFRFITANAPADSPSPQRPPPGNLLDAAPQAPPAAPSPVPPVRIPASEPSATPRPDTLFREIEADTFAAILRAAGMIDVAVRDQREEAPLVDFTARGGLGINGRLANCTRGDHPTRCRAIAFSVCWTREQFGRDLPDAAAVNTYNLTRLAGWAVHDSRGAEPRACMRHAHVIASGSTAANMAQSATAFVAFVEAFRRWQPAPEAQRQAQAPRSAPPSAVSAPSPAPRPDALFREIEADTLAAILRASGMTDIAAHDQRGETPLVNFRARDGLQINGRLANCTRGDHPTRCRAIAFSACWSRPQFGRGLPDVSTVNAYNVTRLAGWVVHDARGAEPRVCMRHAHIVSAGSTAANMAQNTNAFVAFVEGFRRQFPGQAAQP